MIFNIFACTTVATGFAYCIFYLIAYRLSHFVSAFLILPYFVLAEKPLRLMACRVAITISAMCGLFCFLRKIEGLDCSDDRLGVSGMLYTPPPPGTF